MKVFKFGGASVSTAEKIKNVGTILKKYQNEKLLVVISAMGKTTNALEKVVDAFYAGEQQKAIDLFQNIKKEHVDILNQLTNKPISHLNDFFTEIEW
ncbi:MAG: aspartate kinase, partial [Flavisolibacter sp.]